MTDEVGKVIIKDKRFVIRCRENSVEILTLQTQNGKKIDTKSFLNGYKPKGMIISDAPWFNVKWT